MIYLIWAENPNWAGYVSNPEHAHFTEHRSEAAAFDDSVAAFDDVKAVYLSSNITIIKVKLYDIDELVNL